MQTQTIGLFFIVAGVQACVCCAKRDSQLFISGRVVDHTAKSMEGAEVAVYQREHLHQLYNYTANVVGPVIKTDQNGFFSLRAKVTFQYDTFIVARKAGYAIAWDGLNYGSNTLAEGHFLLVLEKPCVMTGTLVDYRGNPVPGAHVQAVPKTSYKGSYLGQRPILAPSEWLSAETNSKGQFHYTEFSADVSADFWVKAPGWQCTYTYTTHYQSSCGFEVWRPDIRLDLPQEYRITGQVNDAKNGKAVAGIGLVLRPQRKREEIVNRYRPFKVVTDAEGRFVCDGLPAGKNRIDIEVSDAGTSLWVGEGIEITVCPGKIDDIIMMVNQGGYTDVTVIDAISKKPVPGMKVDLNTYAERRLPPFETNMDGTTRFLSPSGKQSISVWGTGYTSGGNKEPIAVQSGQTTSVRVELPPKPSVSGRVLNLEGEPVENVLVTIHPAGDQAYTNKHGCFTGKYNAQYGDRGLCLIARDPANSLAACTVTNEFDQPIRLTLSPVTKIKGKIVDPNGAGIPAARTTVRICTDTASSLLGVEVLTDANGYFTLDAIPPAPPSLSYSLAVCAPDYGPAYEEMSPKGPPDTLLTLAPIALEPANMSISGIAVDANGLPAPRVIVKLHGDKGALQPRKNTATNERGAFAFRRICKGYIHSQVNYPSSPGGRGTFRAQAGDHGIRAVLGKTVVHTRQQSLIAKSMPNLSEFGISLNKFDLTRKRLLVCFWDMQQRSSRNCIRELCTKAEEFQTKDIVVVTVHASKTNEIKLNEWIKRNNIPFQASMVQGDEEIIRFRWGIKSLPWLILTSRNHIVTAEGFSPSALDSKVDEAKNTTY